MIIDFHSHILPGADHGSDSVTTTEKQLALITAAGTGALVATPHFYPHRHRLSDFLSRRAAALADLLAIDAPKPRIYSGAEVLVCAGMEEMEGLGSLTIPGTRVILLEMPFTRWNGDLYDTVFAIRDAGFEVVLAHIDRYPREALSPFLSEGMKVQLNADSLCRPFAVRKYRDLVESGLVVALGSDLHGASAADYQRFVRAQKKLRGMAGEIFARTEALLRDAQPAD